MSIRLRLTLWYVGLLALVLLTFAGGLYVLASFVLMREVDGYLQDRGLEVRAQLEEAIQEGSTSSPPDLFPQVLELPPLDVFATPNTYIQVLGITGGDVEIALSSSNLGSDYLPMQVDTLAAVRQGRTVLETVPLETTRLRILSLPVRSETEVAGAVQVGRSLAEVDATRLNLAILLAGGIGMALLVAAGVGMFLARQAFQPIAEITHTALAITRTRDLARRLERTQPPDELGRLASTFNEMLDRIEELFRRQQRFAADISHELRTPLTVIRGNLDLLRREKVESEASLTAMDAEVERMARLVDDLLLLAQFDAGVELEQRPVEMDTLMLEVYRQARARAQGMKVALGHEDQAVVMGDGEWLRQMLLNLVDNALKYTPEGGKVTLSLYREDGWVRLEVADTGIGIPEEDLPHIFERFYRVDRARSRERGGTGLGLSIVKWIAEAHGGRVKAASQMGQGSTFTVWLPEG